MPAFGQTKISSAGASLPGSNFVRFATRSRRRCVIMRCAGDFMVLLSLINRARDQAQEGPALVFGEPVQTASHRASEWPAVFPCRHE
jgi:hypothetical protein